jgi:ADP-ribose pyrophosphatase YjhB (NUDIX family)
MDDKTKTEVKRGVDCIGVSISFVLHDGRGRVMLHKRGEKCRDEQGNWDAGGGALEFDEEFEDCLRREIKEEFCVDALEIKFVSVRNVLRIQNELPTHWISITYAVKVDPAQVQNGEPHKIDELGWFTWDNLPNPKHSQLQNAINEVKELGLLY